MCTTLTAPMLEPIVAPVNHPDMPANLDAPLANTNEGGYTIVTCVACN